MVGGVGGVRLVEVTGMSDTTIYSFDKVLHWSKKKTTKILMDLCVLRVTESKKK